jgi:beta-carotene/zeaxanthin 4-ketolase
MVREGMVHKINLPPLTGLCVAAVIIILWISSLDLLLQVDLDRLILPFILASVLGRTFIQTGLFIVAHDAMHGNVLRPTNNVSSAVSRRCNNLIGQLAVTLYALLPYQKLVINHHQHHQFPGQPNDPDFHDGVHSSPFAWYRRFMQGYLDRQQQVILFFGIGAIFIALHWGLHVALANLFLFWIVPIVLSSMQLFFFGTYLPHRLASNSAEDAPHIIISSNYPPIYSFLTCYHFGYHWEHHQYPTLPWYALPVVRQLSK